MGRKRLNLTDQKFGELLVVELDSSNKSKIVRWICKCSCGNSKSVTGYSLAAGNIISCGCKSDRGKFKRLLTEDAAFNHLYKTYRYKSTARNLEFFLTKEEFRQLTSDKCFYCNGKPSKIYKYGNADKSWYKYNGIDRFNNDLGYIKSNCVSCCKSCNTSKLDMTFDQFKDHISKIYNHLYN